MEGMIQFLRELKMARPDPLKLHIILDQSSYHRSPSTAKFFQIIEAIEPHYLPSYSPNLNSIE